MKLFDVYPLSPIQPVKAKGSLLWDKEGKQFLDLYGGHAVISIGHSHPHYVQLLQKQLENIGFYSNSVINPLQEELAFKLGELSSYQDYQLFLCNSGAEANENALKLASFQNGRKKVIAFQKSFHGRTSLAVAATDDANIQALVNQDHEIIFLPWNDEEQIKTQINDDVCAVIIEGIQGVGGVQVPTVSFLQTLKKACEKHGVVLILDEVQSGYGRSGKFFAHQYAGIQPDLITVAKGMGNGFPIGGVLISPEFKPKYGMLGTTFGGNHLACAAGIAVLDVMKQEHLMERVQRLGETWITIFSEIDGVQEVRGQGLMIGLEFAFPIAKLKQALMEKHQILIGTSSNKHVLRLLPALTIEEKHLQYFKNILQEELTQNLKCI